MTRLLHAIAPQPMDMPIVPHPQEQVPPAVHYVGRSAVAAHNKLPTSDGYPEPVDPWPEAELTSNPLKQIVIEQARSEDDRHTANNRAETLSPQAVASLTPAQAERRRFVVPVVPGRPDAKDPVREIPAQSYEPSAPPEIDTATQQAIINRLHELADGHDSPQRPGAHTIPSAARMLLLAVGRGQQGSNDDRFKSRMYDAMTFVDHLDGIYR